MEISSFMLYSTSEFLFDYGILLNIQKDHLDRHGTMDGYTAAKEKLLALSAMSLVPNTMDIHTLAVRSYVSIFGPIDISRTSFV